MRYIIGVLKDELDYMGGLIKHGIMERRSTQGIAGFSQITHKRFCGINSIS